MISIKSALAIGYASIRKPGWHKGTELIILRGADYFFLYHGHQPNRRPTPMKATVFDFDKEQWEGAGFGGLP
jgi:hypothetical protein